MVSVRLNWDLSLGNVFLMDLSVCFQVLTINEKEKVRYVKFDSVGHQLVTGIANLSPTQSVLGGDRPRTARTGTPPPPTEGGGAGEGGEGPSGRDEEQRRYNVIMDRYERLMERYHNLTFRLVEKKYKFIFF